MHPLDASGDATAPSNGDRPRSDGADLAKVALPIVGNYVALRPVTPNDTAFVANIELTGTNAVAYRHRGQTVGPEQFGAMLWQGVLAQFLIVDSRDGTPCGLAVSYGADFRNAHAYVAAIVRPDLERATWPLEGFELFLEYLFSVFPLRKLYAEASGLTNSHFASDHSTLLHCEGTLRGHDFFDGEYYDKHIYAIYRDEWRDRRRLRGRSGLADALRAAAENPDDKRPDSEAPR